MKFIPEDIDSMLISITKYVEGHSAEESGYGVYYPNMAKALFSSILFKRMVISLISEAVKETKKLERQTDSNFIVTEHTVLQYFDRSSWAVALAFYAGFELGLKKAKEENYVKV